MFKKFLFRLLANAAGFLLADFVLTGVDFAGSYWTVFIAIIVFAFVNTFIKPIVTILSLPAIIFSLGFFYLVVNGLMLWFVSALVPGFEVEGLWTAVAMGIIVVLVNWVLYWLIDENDDCSKLEKQGKTC